MSRRLVLYEDRHWRSLRPLTDLLPVPALAFGASDLARRWLASARLPLAAIEARTGAMAGWHAAPALDATPATASDEAIVVNAAALPGAWFEVALEWRSPALWLADGRSLYIQRQPLPLARIDRLDLATARREPWREISLPDAAGFVPLESGVTVAADGRSYCYSWMTHLNELYVVEGLR